ncbi:hypothetical protein B0H13DRAFT_2333548 [Mycena leptocephala]|nr:hypothetical protein B0H13DRAFT_2333548 [Mycena leptocephala]
MAIPLPDDHYLSPAMHADHIAAINEAINERAIAMNTSPNLIRSMIETALRLSGLGNDGGTATCPPCYYLESLTLSAMLLTTLSLMTSTRFRTQPRQYAQRVEHIATVNRQTHCHGTSVSSPVFGIGCIVAGATGYIDDSSIKSTPAITFIWVKRFKLTVYPPGILPMLAVYSIVRGSLVVCRQSAQSPWLWKQSVTQQPTLLTLQTFSIAAVPEPFSEARGPGMDSPDHSGHFQLFSFSSEALLTPALHHFSKGLQGLLDSIMIVLDTPFLSAGTVAILLNLLLPEEVEEVEDANRRGEKQDVELEAKEF